MRRATDAPVTTKGSSIRRCSSPAGSVCAIPRQAGDCHDGRGFCVVPEGSACAFRVVTAPGTVRPTSPLTLACP
ncbi:MAG: hypothetical protein U0235_12865 [Polyangiaceae bacterium]